MSRVTRHGSNSVNKFVIESISTDPTIFTPHIMLHLYQPPVIDSRLDWQCGRRVSSAIVVLVGWVGVALKAKRRYWSKEMMSERVGLFGGASEVLFLQTITGSCPPVHDEGSADGCGAGGRSRVDVIVAVIIVETGLIVDEPVGDMSGGVDGVEDHEDLVDVEEVVGVLSGESRLLYARYEQTSWRNRVVQNMDYSPALVHSRGQCARKLPDRCPISVQ